MARKATLDRLAQNATQRNRNLVAARWRAWAAEAVLGGARKAHRWTRAVQVQEALGEVHSGGTDLEQPWQYADAELAQRQEV